MKTHTHPRDGDTSTPPPAPDDTAPEVSEPKAEEPEDTKPEAEEAQESESKTDELDETDDEPSEPSASAGSRGTRTAALALTVVAILCAAWFGWSWYGAAHDESLEFSQTRDEVLRAGEQAVHNLNTLDYRNLNQSLKLWQDSSTSELYQQIVQGRTGFEREVRSAKTITSAKVLEAAVTELDQHAGKASVIVGVQITVTPPKGDPVVRKTRLMGQLTRTSTGWKLSALAQAPAGPTG